MQDREADLKIIIRKNNGADIPTLVVEQIISLISDGTLQPGDKLPSELEMTRRFDISRISLREALKLLEAKGYVVSKGRRGKFICPVTDIPLAPSLDAMIRQDRSNIGKLTEARQVILGESAALAAGRAKPEDIEKMAAAVSAIKSAQAADYLTIHTAFFSAISGAVGNTIIAHLNVTLLAPYSSIADQKDTISEKMIRSRSEIERQMESIVTAIKKGAADEARLAVNDHFNHLRKQISL